MSFAYSTDVVTFTYTSLSVPDEATSNGGNTLFCIVFVISSTRLQGSVWMFGFDITNLLVNASCSTRSALCVSFLTFCMISVNFSFNAPVFRLSIFSSRSVSEPDEELERRLDLFFDDFLCFLWDFSPLPDFLCFLCFFDFLWWLPDECLVRFSSGPSALLES